MRIVFYWESESRGYLNPSCRSEKVSEDGIDYMCSILTDDGGLGYLNTISWLDNGLRKISLLSNEENSKYDWCCETWGAELTSDKAKIYSLHDEEYFKIFKLKEFEDALLAWKNFIQSEPNLGVKMIIEIG